MKDARKKSPTPSIVVDAASEEDSHMDSDSDSDQCAHADGGGDDSDGVH